MRQDAQLLPIATARQTYSFVRRMLAADPGASAIMALMFVLAGAAGLVAPWILGAITDDVGVDRNALVSSVLFIAGAAVAGALFGGVAVVMLARVGEPALAELREQVLSRALHLPADRIERSTTGDLLSRLSDDVRTVSDGMKGAVPVIANAAVAVVFTIAGVLALDWRLGLAILAAAPVYVLSVRWYLPRSRPLYREQRIAHGERAEALLTGVNGAPTARAFGIDAALLRQIDDTSKRSADVSVSVYRLSLGFLNRNNLAEFTGLAMVLCVGFLVMRGHATTVGAVTAAALYFLRLFAPIGGLLFTLDRFQSMGAALSRLVGIASLPRSAAPDGDTMVKQGEITLVGVGHEYLPGKPVLHDINLRIAAGERIALVGATGAGKTTLGAIAAGMLRPTSGTVLVDTKPRDPALSTAHSRVFLVTQDAHAFAGTVRDFLTLAKPEAGDEAVQQALTATFADRWVAALPDGVDTVIGDAGHQLTPDQVQHLALARIVLGDPWFVVMDEATAEAGSTGARVLERATEAAMRGRTALVVAHRLTQARLADRILVMRDGKIVEEGTHDRLLALDGRYAELWRAWSGSRMG
ncbi:ABC transporter ATP-binding protein [Micromonospora sp. WMMA1363]|uniref:ABC transporter ATP-binding protein n=1 Tax=Micromonospora sp. WMMA1363 TaxID=3053985 RepID=UPI00259C8F8C|nr:ABC transporter ATP-binding protein [Micromonospora sp. WMMA1363]MDM4719720.1 ABC transporter ATP-binding protein [Micromonospora sp. WMMA1363]